MENKTLQHWIGIFGNSLDMRRGKKECTWNLVNYISKLSNISTFLQYPPSFGLVSSPSAFMAELKWIQWAVEGDKREGRSSEYFSSNHETEINPPLAFMMRPKYVKNRWRPVLVHLKAFNGISESILRSEEVYYYSLGPETIYFCILPKLHWDGDFQPSTWKCGQHFLITASNI